VGEGAEEEEKQGGVQFQRGIPLSK